jgi:ribosomal protein S18 acetylase RimI-like enzyme
VKLPRHDAQQLISGLAQAVIEHYACKNVRLSQLLIDPDDRAVIQAYQQAGFSDLATLLYLQQTLRGNERLPLIADPLKVETYTPERHDLFAQTILATYEGSLDCPALNGKRNIQDIIAGHQAAGEFDPKLWFLLKQDQQPAAVLLLSRATAGASMELVYLGIAPAFRGKGFGDVLMRWSLAVASLDNRQYLNLAVDSANRPALNLYYRHGMMRVGQRLAMIQELPEPQSAETSQRPTNPSTL